MRMLTFAGRNTKEIIRDPLNLMFGMAFPVAVMLLLTAIQSNIPEKIFEIQSLAPGITVFGLSFMTLFSATIISKDRGSSLLQRLYTTPMKPWDFILGYILPMLPMALVQCVFCYAVSLIFGLELSVNILYAALLIVPASLFFVSLGLLFGSFLTDKQVGGVCGALLTNLCAWLSGAWFDLDLVGGLFKKIAYVFPFVHVVQMEKAVLAGNFEGIFPHIWWVLSYSVLAFVLAVFVFLRQMKKQ